MRILIVEDQENLAKLVKSGLKAEDLQWIVFWMEKPASKGSQ